MARHTSAPPTTTAQPSVMQLALISESDLPLWDPLTLYQQLMSEPKSRVNACLHGAGMEWR